VIWLFYIAFNKKDYLIYVELFVVPHVSFMD